MTATPRLAITELANNQATPEAPVNEAILVLEFFANGCHFMSRAANMAEPGTPAEGDAYLLTGTPTGTHWAGQGGKIALFYNGAWAFKTAKEGFIAWVDDEDVVVAFDGTNWNTISSSSAPNVQSVASAATVTPTFSNDQVNITAQAVALTLANPTGTAIPAWGIVIRIKDSGSAQTIAYGTQYRALGVTLPTTTVAAKTLYLGMIYNATDTKWDVVSVAQQA